MYIIYLHIYITEYLRETGYHKSHVTTLNNEPVNGSRFYPIPDIIRCKKHIR